MIASKDDVHSSIDIADWVRKNSREKVPLNFIDSEEINIFGDKEYDEERITEL